MVSAMGWEEPGPNEFIVPPNLTDLEISNRIGKMSKSNLIKVLAVFTSRDDK